MPRLLLLLALLAAPVGARAQASLAGPVPVPEYAGASPAGVNRQPAAGAVTFSRDPLRSAEVAVDAAGGRHAAFASLGDLDDAARKPTYYAYCPPAADCADPAAWARVEVARDAPFVQLALDVGGRPRLLLFNDRATVGGEPGTVYAFAACDAGYTAAAGWRLRTVATSRAAGAVDSDRHPVGRFALDAAGRPRFAFYDGTRWLSDTAWEQPSYLADCDADCAADGEWRLVRLPDALRIG